MEEYLNFAITIAKKAKEIMLDNWNCDKDISFKGDKSIVTKVDKEINSYLIDQVKEKYPTHCVVGEEESFNESSNEWICDPVDGTAMYARKIPTCVFSLAYAEKGIPLVGVVYDVFNDEMYTAIKGQKAYKNNQQINVNDYLLDDVRSVVQYDAWPAAEYDIFDTIREINKKSYTVSIGSIIRAAMCVADGNFTACIFPGTVNKYTDIAALKVIVESAGGIVRDIEGNEQVYDKTINGTIISNKANYTEILSIVSKTKIKK